MNVTQEYLVVLERLLFLRNREEGQFEQALSSLNWWVRDLSIGFAVAAAVALVLIIAFLCVYHPRIRRGGFWLPLHGLFGGTPTLYLHTRPASVCGLFGNCRRLKKSKSWGFRLMNRICFRSRLK